MVSNMAALTVHVCLTLCQAASWTASLCIGTGESASCFVKKLLACHGDKSQEVSALCWVQAVQL